VKPLLLCAVIFLSIPGSATISQVQSTANWSCSGTSCAQPFASKPATGNLIAVWTFWQSSGAFTASVADTLCPAPCASYLSAVGPTLQASASTPTTAQIFYFKNLQNLHNLSDTVTVTFAGTGTISAAGVVIVEYSGADQNYPLDSVSAGYSTGGNATSLLDSGAVAPANSNLLVFAGGISDGGAANAGTGFTSIQSHNFSSGMAITEQNSSAITGNNVLQRATACLGPPPLPCPTTPTGNWVMQMAIFRDASWTVAGGGWNPVRVGQIRKANEFPGSDIGAQINAAYADGPSTGVHIEVAAGSYNFLTPISFNSPGKPAYLECDPGVQGNILNPNATTRLIFTGASGTGGWPTHSVCESE